MSQLIYNNIELKLIKTNSVDRTPVYSPDGTEYLYTEFTIDILATYSPSSLATSYSPAGIQQPGWMPEITDSAIRHYLMQPRRTLYFAEGGLTIVSVSGDPFGEALDERNGPLPQSCSVRRIVGVRLWYVEYSVKAWIIECPPGSFVSPIASSRYSRSESIDQDYMSTLVTSGIASFRSNILSNLAFDADAFRGYLIPPPLLGYQRMNLQFSLASDGISVTWATTDVEVKHDLGRVGQPDLFGTAASVGITKMDLVYSVSSPRFGAEVKMAGWGAIVNIEVSATGCKFGNNLDILIFCIRTALNRLGSSYVNGILSDGMVIDDYFNNSVKLNLTYTVLQVNPNAEGVFDMAVPIVGFVGSPIESLPDVGGWNPAPLFENSTRGSAAYMLAVNAFATACLTDPSTVGQDDSGTQIPPNAYYQQSTGVGTSPQVSAFYSPPTEPSQSLRQPSQGRTPNPEKAGAPGTLDTSSSQTTRFTGRFIVPIAVAMDSTGSGPGGSPPGGGSLGDTTTMAAPGSTEADPPPKPNAVVIQTHQPYSTRESLFDLRYANFNPLIPDPIPPDGDDKGPLRLLTSSITTDNIELGPDGYTPIFSVRGKYRLGITNDVGAQAPLSYNIPQYARIDVNSPHASIDKPDYKQGYMNNDFRAGNNTA